MPVVPNASAEPGALRPAQGTQRDPVLKTAEEEEEERRKREPTLTSVAPLFIFIKLWNELSELYM